MNQLLSKVGIVREACFVGNVCQVRPPDNRIDRFNKDGPEISDGLAQLQLDLTTYQPNICVLLGKTALYCAYGQMDIGKLRGTLFESGFGFLNMENKAFHRRKCLATYHPASCLHANEGSSGEVHQYWRAAIITFDLAKALRHATQPELVLPMRKARINLTPDEMVAELDSIVRSHTRTAIDIEGGIGSMSCISVATSSQDSFIIPLCHMDRSNFYEDPADEVRIWRALSTFLSDPLCPKVLQNSLYDRFVLQYSYNIVVRGVVDDTMLQHWELYCEMEKNLGFQASIYTDEPYYKQERKSEDRDTFWIYCCKDSMVTYEISSKLDALLDSESKRHYSFNMSLLNALLYMENHGILYDVELARTRLREVEQEVARNQMQLNQIAGIKCLDAKAPKTDIFRTCQELMCYKRDPNKPKKEFAPHWDTIVRLCLGPVPPTEGELGWLNSLCGFGLNVKSKKFKDFLYVECKLPTQWKQDPKTKEMRPTTDYEALLKLSKKHDHPALKVSIEIGRLRTRVQMLSIHPCQDGRMRCSYNEVGSETGRVTSSKSVIPVGDGNRAGTNMQTVSDDWDLDDPDNLLSEGLRNLYKADEGCYIGQCDLKGSDGWTIGAQMASLGDLAMLDDLKAGLKPAQIVAYILKHGAQSVKSRNRSELKELLKEIKKEDWEYFVSKQGIWGTCYLMGPRKLAERVFIESEGKVNLSEREAKDFQQAIFTRYNVKILHQHYEREIARAGYPYKLTAPNGQTRRFFGRKDEILGEVLSHLPQAVTTYATNLALYRLWMDEENKKDNQLRVRPLHQVHDALLLQWKIEETEWAIANIKKWFNNPITISGQLIIIPFDGSYGTNWALDEGSKVGDI